MDLPEVAELDLNPVIALPDRSSRSMRGPASGGWSSAPAARPGSRLRVSRERDRRSHGCCRADASRRSGHGGKREDFERIVVGIDETPQSIEALHQAQKHARAGREATSSCCRGRVGRGSRRLRGLPSVDEVQIGARDALARAMEQTDAVDARLVQGDPTRSLLGEIAREHATLVALGTHGHSRAAGIVLGGTATTLLHEAPCAVLIARPPRGWKRFPSSLAVGIDGSTQSRKALSAALDLANRLDIPLRRVVATEGKAVMIEGLRDVAGLEWDEREAVRRPAGGLAGVRRRRRRQPRAARDRRPG